MNQFLPVTGSGTYCNPVPFSDGRKHTNPDPFILRWCGRYYCYASDAKGAKVSVSEDLVHWEDRGYAISEDGYHQYWAPSVIYLNGTFYMYYSNIPADEEDCHEQHLKMAEADSPLGPFVWQKTFFDQFSIDSHPLLWNGKMYMFYSVNDWAGTEEKVAGTCIMLDEMRSPDAFAGHPRPVVLPSIRKEIYAENRFGDGRDWYTIEGACTVPRSGKVWLLYSANAYEHEDYFVGTAVAEDRPGLDRMEWEKYPDSHHWCPLVKRNHLVEGTGHNTVAKAPNMVDDWIVYHGRDAAEELILGTEQRNMRIDPLYYSGRRMMCFGPTAERRPAPLKPDISLKDRVVKAPLMAGESPEVYLMECWIKAAKSHTGVRFGIYLDYRDEKNYVEIQLYSGQQKLRLLDCGNGVITVRGELELRPEFDYTVPHLFRIQRNFDCYTVWMDETCMGTSRAGQTGADAAGGRAGKAGEDVPGRYHGKIGVIPYFSQVTVCSLALTEHALLEGVQLNQLPHYYELSKGMADESGLSFGEGRIQLNGKIKAESYTEELELEVDGENPQLEASRGDTVIGSGVGKENQFTLYHAVHGGQEWMLLDGEPVPAVQKGTEPFCIRLKGLRVVRYRFTRI